VAFSAALAHGYSSAASDASEHKSSEIVPKAPLVSFGCNRIRAIELDPWIAAKRDQRAMISVPREAYRETDRRLRLRPPVSHTALSIGSTGMLPLGNAVEAFPARSHSQSRCSASTCARTVPPVLAGGGFAGGSGGIAMPWTLNIRRSRAFSSRSGLFSSSGDSNGK